MLVISCWIQWVFYPVITVSKLSTVHIYRYAQAQNEEDEQEPFFLCFYKRGRVKKILLLGLGWVLFLSCTLVPRVFSVASNKDSSISDCFVWRVSGVSCALSFRKGMHQLEESQCQELSNFLTNVFPCKDEDLRIWKPSPVRVFSVKSFCVILEGSTKITQFLKSFCVILEGSTKITQFFKFFCVILEGSTRPI